MKLGNYFAGSKFEDNPVPMPERHVRANEIYSAQFSDKEDDDVVYDLEEFMQYAEQ